MRYVAAALLLGLGGSDINKNNIKKLLDVVGIECDGEKADLVVSQLSGKNLEELIAEGSTKLASMPAGGGGAAPAAAAGGGGGGAAAAAPAEEKKESEPEEESDDDMGFGLFD